MSGGGGGGGGGHFPWARLNAFVDKEEKQGRTKEITELVKTSVGALKGALGLGTDKSGKGITKSAKKKKAKKKKEKHKKRKLKRKQKATLASLAGQGNPSALSSLVSPGSSSSSSPSPGSGSSSSSSGKKKRKHSGSGFTRRLASVLNLARGEGPTTKTVDDVAPPPAKKQKSSDADGGGAGPADNSKPGSFSWSLLEKMSDLQAQAPPPRY